jgi:hypothetical protein
MTSETYILEKGTILYRGDTPYFLKNMERNGEPSDKLVLENKPTFFALEPDDVHQYGIIYGWKVPETVELVLLDNHKVMTEIYNGATKRPDVQRVMRENYGYRPDGFADRVSYFEKDIIFYQYLCEKGYLGYASYDLEDGERTSVEIMVCNPTGYTCEGLFYPNVVKDHNLYIHNQIQKYYERVNPNGNQKRKKAKVAESPAKGQGWSPEKEGRMFESPVKGRGLFDKTPVKTGTNLFGESPVKEGTNLFGESPVKDNSKRNLFGSPDGSPKHVLKTPKKKGGSKKNKKRKTRRRGVIHSKNSKSHPHDNS